MPKQTDSGNIFPQSTCGKNLQASAPMQSGAQFKRERSDEPVLSFDVSIIYSSS